MKRAAQTIDSVVPPKKPTLEKVQTALWFDNKTVPEHEETDELLHSKIDSLIGEFKELKLHVTSTAKIKETCPKSLTAVDSKCLAKTTEVLLLWPEVKNILDLVQLCKHVNFFLEMQKKEFSQWFGARHAFSTLKMSRRILHHNYQTQWLLQKNFERLDGFGHVYTLLQFSLLH